MRVLVISPVFPLPLLSGAKVRLYHTIRCLRELGHDVGLLSPVQYDEMDCIDQLRPLLSDMRLTPVPGPGQAWRGSRIGVRLKKLGLLFTDLARGLTVTSVRFHHPDIARAVDELAPSYDHILVELHYMAANVSARVFRRTPYKPVLVEDDISFKPHDLAWRLAQGWERQRLRRAYLSARRTEMGVLRLFRRVLAVSPQDQHELSFLAPHALVGCAPNGVDLDSIPLQPRTPASPPYVLYVGGLLHYPNFDAIRYFLESCLPAMRQAIAQLTLVVAGDQGNRRGELEALGGGAVSFLGFVKDLGELYAGATALVVPLRIGSGTRLKVLEAMAAGAPVVSTTIGVEGLPLEDGIHFLRADDPQSMLEACARLVADPDLGRRLAVRARALCEEKFGWRTIIRDMARWLEATRKGESDG